MLYPNSENSRIRKPVFPVNSDYIPTLIFLLVRVAFMNFTRFSQNLQALYRIFSENILSLILKLNIIINIDRASQRMLHRDRRPSPSNLFQDPAPSQKFHKKHNWHVKSIPQPLLSLAETRIWTTSLVVFAEDPFCFTFLDDYRCVPKTENYCSRLEAVTKKNERIVFERWALYRRYVLVLKIRQSTYPPVMKNLLQWRWFGFSFLRLGRFDQWPLTSFIRSIHGRCLIPVLAVCGRNPTQSCNTQFQTGSVVSQYSIMMDNESGF